GGVGELDVVEGRADGDVQDAVAVDVAGGGDGVSEEVPVVSAGEGRDDRPVGAADDLGLAGDGQDGFGASGRADDDLAEAVAVHVLERGDACAEVAVDGLAVDAADDVFTGGVEVDAAAVPVGVGRA